MVSVAECPLRNRMPGEPRSGVVGPLSQLAASSRANARAATPTNRPGADLTRRISRGFIGRETRNLLWFAGHPPPAARGGAAAVKLHDEPCRVTLIGFRASRRNPVCTHSMNAFHTVHVLSHCVSATEARGTSTSRRACALRRPATRRRLSAVTRSHAKTRRRRERGRRRCSLRVFAAFSEISFRRRMATIWNGNAQVVTSLHDQEFVGGRVSLSRKQVCVTRALWPRTSLLRARLFAASCPDRIRRLSPPCRQTHPGREAGPQSHGPRRGGRATEEGRCWLPRQPLRRR